MLQAFALNVTEEADDFEEDGEIDDEEFLETDEQEVSVVQIEKLSPPLTESPSLPTDEISTSPVSIKKSPRINVKFKKTQICQYWWTLEQTEI